MDKLRKLIPSSIWNYIAQSARSARTYRELVDIVMNELIDLKTGMLQGEKSPTLNEVQFPTSDVASKGKRGFKGKCWNCGKEGHRSSGCEEPRTGGK